jgi:hypothetical protein
MQHQEKKRLKQQRKITCCNSKIKPTATELAGTLATAASLRSRGGGGGESSDP